MANTIKETLMVLGNFLDGLLPGETWNMSTFELIRNVEVLGPRYLSFISNE